MCCLSIVPFSSVADGVMKEEQNAEEYEGQYREQKLSEGFEHGKSNLFPFDHIYPSFQTEPVAA